MIYYKLNPNVGEINNNNKTGTYKSPVFNSPHNHLQILLNRLYYN